MPGMSQTMNIGVDIGGTFTDTVVIDRERNVTIGKAPSTPPDFERGFIDSITAAAERMGLSAEDALAQCSGLFHGCTVGTNALVERRTARVGLMATRGMSDSLFVMLGGSRNWGLAPEDLAHVSMHTKPEPLVEKRFVEEIDQRVAFDGEVIVELNEGQCREAVQRLLDQGVEAFAISFMWSVMNPAHERAAARIVREMAPDAFVSISSDVVSRTGEYQRTVATVVNAAIGPVMSRYLGKLTDQLKVKGYDGTLYVMSCSGGVLTSDYARRLPLLTIDSGPVGGLIGAGALARVAAAGGEEHDVITADMGGTTLDVGVIRKGEPLTRATSSFDQYKYFVPTVDIHSVGAGGGSIIRFDPKSQTLRVGPESAGAVPGPVAYQRGGTQPTVSDADLVLGFLNPKFFLGGAIDLDVQKARDALARTGEPLGFDADATAAAAVRIVDNQMADAIRLASIKQGYDPRSHVMYAFGGGGPVHASALGRELGIAKIVVPLGDLASGWSAFGVVSSDALVVQELPKRLDAPFDVDALNSAWAELEARVSKIMDEQGIAAEEVTLERSVDLRYTAQVNDVSVPAPSGTYTDESAATLIDTFEREYSRLFGEGSGYAEAGHVLTAVRVIGRAPRSQAKLDRAAPDAPAGDSALRGERDVLFFGESTQRTPTAIYDGSRLTHGVAVEGPAIIEFADTTVVLWRDDRASIDSFGSVVIELDRADPS